MVGGLGIEKGFAGFVEMGSRGRSGRHVDTASIVGHIGGLADIEKGLAGFGEFGSQVSCV